MVTESLPLYISTTQTNPVVTESIPLYISITQANMVVTESLLLYISIAQTHLVVTESLSLSSSSIPQSRGSLGHHRLFRNQFFFHFPLFSTALWDLPNSRPVHSLMLSSHLFLCLPCLPPFTLQQIRPLPSALKIATGDSLQATHWSQSFEPPPLSS